MIVLGLTGSVGMGKSTAAKMLEKQLGVPVHDSDRAAQKTIEPGGPAVAAVAQLWPEAYVKEDDSINRKILGPIVFKDPEQLKQLNAIIHPLVVQSQQEFLKEQRRHGIGIVALDIPLLYETGADKRVDKVIVVSAPFFIQHQRVMARPGMTEAKFRGTLANQMPDAVKRARADFVVETGQGLHATFVSLKKIIESFPNAQNRRRLPTYDR